MLSLGHGLPDGPSGLSRRDFLRAGGLGALGASLADPLAALAGEGPGDRSVIFLMLVGGPSQLETFDPKPDATSEVRGPFQSIATSVPGVRFNEHLPKLARRMDQVTLIRSLHHDAAPIHETGLQLLQTGRLCRLGDDHPYLGSVAARVLGSRGSAPPCVVLPAPIGNTGVGISHGQNAGVLGPEYDPLLIQGDPSSIAFDAANLGISGRLSHGTRRAFDLSEEKVGVREAYGRTTFGQSCLLARRLVEAGVRVVTVNMYESVFNRVSWDCHGSRPFSTLDDYQREVLPTFDTALSALLDDLARSGRLDSTLVVATGEFGRTPRINASGGRDHWPGVWSALLAGAGTNRGRVIGTSDATASEPADRPVTPPELLATVYRTLEIDTGRSLTLADGSSRTVAGDADPVLEVFA